MLVKDIEAEDVEADDVEDHTPEGEADDVPGLCEEGGERCTGPFEGASVAGDAKSHLRRYCFYAEFFKERDEIC